MPKEVIESVRIVIRTPDNVKLVLEGKGDATRGMITAFCLMPPDRRERFLFRVHEEHEKCMKQELERATAHSGTPGDTP